MKNFIAIAAFMALLATGCAGSDSPDDAAAASGDSVTTTTEQNQSQPVQSTAAPGSAEEQQELADAELEGFVTAEDADDLDLQDAVPLNEGSLPSSQTTVPEAVQERSQEVEAEIREVPVEEVSDDLLVTINQLEESGLDVGGRWTGPQLIDLGARLCSALVIETDVSGLSRSAQAVAQTWPDIGDAQIEDVVAVGPQLAGLFCPNELTRLFGG